MSVQRLIWRRSTKALGGHGQVLGIAVHVVECVVVILIAGIEAITVLVDAVAQHLGGQRSPTRVLVVTVEGLRAAVTILVDVASIREVGRWIASRAQ